MNETEAYIISLFVTALVATLAGILAPSGEGGGIARHLRLVAALAVVCVLISPTLILVEGLRNAMNGEWESDTSSKEEIYEEMQGAMQAASKQYFVQMLSETLAKEFDIAEDDLRCHVVWQGDGEEMRPERVTVVLSGKAIWKDPSRIENFVSALLGCECVTAIE